MFFNILLKSVFERIALMTYVYKVEYLLFVYEKLQNRVDKKVGANVPYDLQQANTGAVVICGEEKGYDYGLIEIRDDEFADMQKSSEWWANNLADVLRAYLK